MKNKKKETKENKANVEEEEEEGPLASSSICAFFKNILSPYW